jgi:predicted CXXCH cytochrome family protein
VALSIGGRWRQLYLTKPVSDTFRILPSQWIVETQTWETYDYADGGGTDDWLESCGSCDVTGLDQASGTFTEYGIGCESCHGPAAAHAEDPENVKPFAEVDDQVCGACHSRGASADGHAFPADYRPGDDLATHFTPQISAQTTWPDGSARMNHQQYTDWNLENTMQQDESTSCISCHLVHETGVEPGQLAAPTNELCVGCHSDKIAIIDHIPYHEKASRTHTFLCSDCHMPAMATSAVAWDIHNHSLLQPNPDASIEHGGAEGMQNACNTCHTDYGEGPEWASQTIAWTKSQTDLGSDSFFGPGPTPTSPPPPTPIPSAGQPPIPIKEHTGQRIRNTVLGGMALAGVLFVALIIGFVVRRRSNHV